MSIDTDIVFVVGFILGILTIPSILSAYSRDHTPRFSIIMVVISMSMIGYAVKTKPNSYGFDEIPRVFVSVVGRLAT